MAAPRPLGDKSISEAEDFVRTFAAFWSAPTVPAFEALMHPDVRLVQPLAPPVRGLAEASAWLANMLALLPDIRIAVERWSGTPDALFIEWTATATFAGKPVRWSAVDRFHIEGGKARERVAYFDALPLVGMIATRPSGWFGVLRARLGARRRRGAA